jgi:hypothetical protein
MIADLSFLYYRSNFFYFNLAECLLLNMSMYYLSFRVELRLRKNLRLARKLAYHYAPKKGSSLNMSEIDRTAARCISMLCVLIPFMKASRSGRSKNENDVLQLHPI